MGGNLLAFSIIFSILLISSGLSVDYAFAGNPDELTVTKTATPQTINLFGLGGVDTTTVEIQVDGFGEDSMVDVLLLMDASGSVGSSDFDMEKTFVNDVINSVFPDPEDRVGIIRFSTSVDTLYQFDDDQTRTTLSSFVNTISYPGGWTDTLGALNQAIVEFDTLSSTEKDKLIIIITDGNPILSGEAQDVCPLNADLQSRDIKVVFVAVGSNIDTSKIDCLVDDPTIDIISVADFNNLDGVVIQFGLDNAPSNIDLIETTQSYIINEGSFSIPPDVTTTLVGGQTQLTWLNIGQHTGNGDIVLSQGESFLVSFTANSDLAGNNLDVNDLVESEIKFIDLDGALMSISLPQTTINVIIDDDGDGVPDIDDICPGGDDNLDTDTDGTPDFCDATPNGDDDNDGVDNPVDICPAGDDNVDTDNDGTPDACDLTPNGDDDNDGVDNLIDNCPDTPNTDQLDTDSDGVGDACESPITCGTGTTLNTSTNQCEADVTQSDLDALQVIIDNLNSLITGPGEIINSLILQIQTLVDGDMLDKKDSKKVLKDLDKALKDLQKGNEKACKDVSKFVKDANKLVKKGDLDETKAQPLLDDANALLAECPVKDKKNKD